MTASAKKSKNQKEQINENGSENKSKNWNSRQIKVIPGKCTESRIRNSKSTNSSRKNSPKLTILKNFGMISELKNSVRGLKRKKNS